MWVGGNTRAARARAHKGQKRRGVRRPLDVAAAPRRSGGGGGTTQVMGGQRGGQMCVAHHWEQADTDGRRGHRFWCMKQAGSKDRGATWDERAFVASA